jgi:hypothetical protein
MFLIALIILIWYCAKHDILSISNYPHIEKLFKKLKENHTDIVEETKKWIDNKLRICYLTSESTHLMS